MIALALAVALLAVSDDPSLNSTSETNSSARAVEATSPADNPVTRPIWTRRPSRDDLVRLYPRNIGDAKTVRVVAKCQIGPDGKFRNCEIVREDPASEAFAEATISLSKLFQMKPEDGEGKAVAGRQLFLPVTWDPGLAR
jgi:hypothetical protein